jgi:UPF0755 protein
MRKLLIAVLLLLLAGGGSAAYLWLAWTQPYKNFPSEGVFVTVPHGASCRAIARILKENGVIPSELAFRLYCRRHKRQTLQAGEYFFDHAITGREVFDTLAAGRVYEKSVAIPEGYTMFDIADLLDKEGVLSRDMFLAVARDASQIHDLFPEARSLEGFLFPATYQFPHRPAPQDVTAAMVRKFREVWATLNPEPVLGRRSVGEVVTLASLVERETPKGDERPLVAAVFANRLRLGRGLQCDPTVIYALQLVGRYNGTLTSADLRFDSAYNTYRYRGLPPGPIGNPGIGSLRAALAPAKVDYLYFVADTQGGHFFSRTLEEHNRNVRRYHKLLALNGKEEPEEEDPPPPPPPKRQHHSKNHKKRNT